MSFLKKLFRFISFKANEGIDRLITVRQQSQEILAKLKEESKALENILIENRATLLSLRQDREKAVQGIATHEGYMLQADANITSLQKQLENTSLSVAETDALQTKLDEENNRLSRLNDHIITLNHKVEEYDRCIATVQAQDDNLKKMSTMFADKAAQAHRTLETTEIRIKTANSMLKTGNGGLSSEILSQIKELEDEANRLSNLAEAKASLEEDKAKANLEDIAQHYRQNNALSVQERLAQLKAKQAK